MAEVVAAVVAVLVAKALDLVIEAVKHKPRQESPSRTTTVVILSDRHPVKLG
jgi:hypothetical protein